jgi:hypothetical protein
MHPQAARHSCVSGYTVVHILNYASCFSRLCPPSHTGMTRIEKDKVLRLTPFDACGSILGGEYTCAVFCWLSGANGRFG